MFAIFSMVSQLNYASAVRQLSLAGNWSCYIAFIKATRLLWKKKNNLQNAGIVLLLGQCFKATLCNFDREPWLWETKLNDAHSYVAQNSNFSKSGSYFMQKMFLWFSLWCPTTSLPQLCDSRKFLKATCRLPADWSSSYSTGSLLVTAPLK